MRQLTSLDAQFLAMETPRVYGHVGGFAVHDPTTAPGGSPARGFGRAAGGKYEGGRRRLTSLAARFLAMEPPRVNGPGGGFAAHTPPTAPGGTLTREDICRLVGERIPRLPPFRWKLA